MIQGRTCIIVGHDLQISHVCLFQNCDQQSRWLCQKCLQIKIHDHGSEIQNQIVQIKQFEKMMVEKRNRINKTYDQIGKILAVSIGLSKNLQLLVEFVKTLQKQKLSNTAWIKLNEIKDFSQLYALETESIEQVVAACRDFNYSEDLKQYVSMLKIDINKFDQITNSLDNLNTQDQKLLYESMIFQDLSKVQEQIQQYKYQEHKINSDFAVGAVQVSNNLKFIAASGGFNLKIWNQQTLKVLHQFQLLNRINILKFSFDSQILFVSSRDGYVYSFITEKSFQNNFRQKIHESQIGQILIINNNKNNIIFTCDKTEIRKTDCLKNETLMILKLFAIDLDYDIERNYLLINTSQTVSLWNGQYGHMLFDKQFDKQYNSGIKFVGNFSQMLIYFVNSGFHLYNIDLKKKKFQQIRTVSNLKLLSFSLTLKQQFIVTFSTKELEIRSFSGVIKSIEHQLKFEQTDYKFHIEQVENMRTLIVTNGTEVKLFKVV